MKALQVIAARVNRASLRERALLFFAAVSVLALFWNLALMAPLAARRAALAQNLEEIRQRLANTGSGEDPDSPAARYAAAKSREAAAQLDARNAALQTAHAELAHARSDLGERLAFAHRAEHDEAGRVQRVRVPGARIEHGAFPGRNARLHVGLALDRNAREVPHHEERVLIVDRHAPFEMLVGTEAIGP